MSPRWWNETELATPVPDTTRVVAAGAGLVWTYRDPCRYEIHCDDDSLPYGELRLGRQYSAVRWDGSRKTVLAQNVSVAKAKAVILDDKRV